MVRIIIDRRYGKHQTVGRLYVFNERNGVEYDCYSFELPNLGNQRRISCIPEGTYTIIKHKSPKFGDCLWIQDVPNRSEILIHDKVNFVGSKNPRTGNSDLLGCVAPAESKMDIDGDGILDIAPKSSTIALKKILALVPNKFLITIKSSQEEYKGEAVVA